jgi:hypothetical protein
MRRAAISNLDQTCGYLGTKLVAGAGITLTAVNPSADATLSIAATGAVAAVTFTDISALCTVSTLLVDGSLMKRVALCDDTVRKMATILFELRGTYDEVDPGLPFYLQLPSATVIPKRPNGNLSFTDPIAVIEGGVFRSSPGKTIPTDYFGTTRILFSADYANNVFSAAVGTRGTIGQIQYYYV